jgi:2-keto-4-pentenoate hydratase/2-oxohepta-3-ene-1,7-dioic acid hydratase in catechol pathway
MTNLDSFGLASASFDGGAPVPALIVGDRVIRLDGGAGLPDLLDDWDKVLPMLAAAAKGESAPLASVKLAAPYVPRQVFCTGANYRKHVIGLIMGDPSMRGPDDEAATDEERRAKAEAMMDERAKNALPYCFLKLPSCVVGPEDAVVLPRNVEKPDWEQEMGVVICRRSRHVTAAEAMDHVAGYAVVNDVTAREHIFRRDAGAIGADWLSGKCFPTFLPFGPMIVPKQFVPNPYDLNIRLSVNGKVYQDETTADMMIDIARQIEYLSDRVELLPGDLICTGSPYGNGSAFGVYLQPGDVMEGTITGLGTLRNPCVAER